MPKSLPITSEIEGWIKSKEGNEDLDLSGIAVFEAIQLNTRPIDKRGSIFNGGVVSRSTLSEMEALLNGGKTIPLHILHQQHSDLPTGRVFHAAVRDLENGDSEIRGLFYMPNNKAELIADIESGVIDEVSVGLQSKHMFCSECSWDYLGDDANIMHFIDQTCENGHTIGEDGVHLRMVGMEKWYETSLVSIGAADNAKIISRSKSVLGGRDSERLAANGIGSDAVVLFASIKESKPMSKENEGGNGEVKLSGVAEVVTQIADLTGQVATLTAERDALKTSSEAMTAKVTELEATASAEKTELSASLKTAQDSLIEVIAFLTEQAKAALVASGKEKPEVPEDLTGLLSAIKDSGLKLHQIVGSDGTSGTGNESVSDLEVKRAEAARLSAFKTRPNK